MKWPFSILAIIAAGVAACDIGARELWAIPEPFRGIWVSSDTAISRVVVGERTVVFRREDGKERECKVREVHVYQTGYLSFSPHKVTRVLCESMDARRLAQLNETLDRSYTLEEATWIIYFIQSDPEVYSPIEIRDSEEPFNEKRTSLLGEFRRP